MRGSTRSQSERSTFKRIMPHIQRIEADFDKYLDGKHRLAEYVWTRHLSEYVWTDIYQKLAKNHGADRPKIRGRCCNNCGGAENIYTDQGGRSCAGARGAPPKSLDSDENFKPEHTLFCRELRFVAIYALFWRSLGKKSAFLGQKQSFLGKKCTITWKNCIFH